MWQSLKIALLNYPCSLKWALNALLRIKEAIHEGKYTFQTTNEEHAAFKRLSLVTFLSRGEYVSFFRKQFIQALVYNIYARMLNSKNEAAIKNFEISIYHSSNL